MKHSLLSPFVPRPRGRASYARVLEFDSAVSSNEQVVPFDYDDPNLPVWVDLLGLLLAVLSVAVIVIIIAFILSRIRKKHLIVDDVESQTTGAESFKMTMLLEESEGWQKEIKRIMMRLKGSSGQTSQCKTTTIPDHIRPQLRQVFVY